MSIIICPECAKRITDNVDKCPNCGCLKNEFVTLMNRDEKDYIVLLLGKYRIRFNGKYWNYIQLRKVYEANARSLRSQLISVYASSRDFGYIIKSFPYIVGVKMEQMLDWSMRLLYECKIPMTAELFLEKYFDKNESYEDERYYRLNYNEIITEVVEQYAEITNEKAELAKYRQMQKASRSRWRGGGFGVKGAMKGAMMAGVLNAGTDFMRSFGDNAQKNSDDTYIAGQISKLKESRSVQRKMINGAYQVILGIFFAVLNELHENRVLDTAEFTNEQCIQAENIYMSTIKYETDDKKVITGCLDAITKFPYLDSPYETLYEKYKQTPAVTSIFSFLQFFGMNISIAGIEVTKYMEIEAALKQYIDISKFDFDTFTTDQYYIASEAIEKLEEEYYSSLKNNFNCWRLCEYIKHAQEIGVSNGVSSKEKQASMEEYIPLLMERHVDMESMSCCSPYIWVAGTKITGPIIFKSDEKEIYARKYIEDEKRYLLIYDRSGIWGKGKIGFGIFDEGIVFFETGKIALFKDIVECRFNEERASLVIKTSRDVYEFGYRKKANIMFKAYYNKSADYVTKNIIYPIIEHYQNLHSINLLN